MHEGLYEELRRVARRSTLITYGEVAPMVGIRINPTTVGRLGHLLAEIGRYEHRQCRSLLPVLALTWHARPCPPRTPS